MQFVSGDSSSATLHSVVEELVRFRLKVRQFALATGEATKEARRQRLLERQPLLEACDTLRQDLAAHGVSIKVSHCHRGRVNGDDHPEMLCKPAGSHRHGGGSKLRSPVIMLLVSRYPSCDEKEGMGSEPGGTLRWRDLGEGQSQNLEGDCGPRTCVLQTCALASPFLPQVLPPPDNGRQQLTVSKHPAASCSAAQQAVDTAGSAS